MSPATATARRWWLLALVGTSILCGSVLGLSNGIGVRFWIGTAILLALLLFWGLVARPEDGQEDTPRSVAVLVVTIAAAGALTSVDTTLAIFQGFAYPAAWVLLTPVRRPIVATAIIAAVEAVGFLIRLGVTPNSVGLALVIEGISLVFSVAMGLWISRIARLSEERRRLLDELTAAQEQLALLHRDAGATGERERLARELHDTIAQSLTAQVLLTQRARRELTSGALRDETLELIETNSRETLAETRSLVAASARVELPGGGLLEALHHLATRFERESGIVVVVSSSLDDQQLPRDAEVVLLRCAQEGLANVRKHAGAHAVRLELSAESGTAVVRVIDDGHGFDPDHAASGFGLSGLRDRLGLVGGELSVDGTAGSTTLEARLPIGTPA
ncbi:MAG: sensor histidine kinase [Pseudolysinimonas sp.]